MQVEVIISRKFINQVVIVCEPYEGAEHQRTIAVILYPFAVTILPIHGVYNIMNIVFIMY